MFAALATAIGNLARPLAILMLASGCLFIMGWSPFVDDASNLVGILTAGGTILAVLVGARTIDNVTATKAQAEVDKVKAAASGGTQP